MDTQPTLGGLALTSLHNVFQTIFPDGSTVHILALSSSPFPIITRHLRCQGEALIQIDATTILL